MIRLAGAADAAQIHAIYAPVVRDTVVSFELEPPGVDVIAARVRATLDAGFPWLVAEGAGRILGYAYASRHRERAAYDWSTDVSVYVHEDARRRGVGRALYTSLFAVLTLQGYHNAYAGATLPNPASVALHEAVGFREIGIYWSVGY
ncbi:MAG: GNAT family N-acetyltransferase [Longimicrobiales bacterium]